MRAVQRVCSAQNPFAAAHARFPMHGTHGCARELSRARKASFPLRNKLDRRPQMLKTLMISAAVSALMVSGALAQADMSPKPPAATAPKAEAIPHDTAKFIAAQSTDQWVFSKFKGTDVLGPDNAHIGNVSDMHVDQNAQILGLVVGVGGLLGIGEKRVAIEMGRLQTVNAGTGISSDGDGGSK